MGTINREEHYEQVTYVKWFRSVHKGVEIFAIPNGCHIASAANRAYFDAEGRTSGIPDLFIPAWLLWIEMKRKGYKPRKTLTDTEKKQQFWQNYLKECGHWVYQCCGFEEAKEITEEFKRIRTSFLIKNYGDMV